MTKTWLLVTHALLASVVNAQRVAPPAAKFTTRLDVPYGDLPAQRLDVYIPKDAHGTPVMIYVHGGGWRRGDKRAVGQKVEFFTGMGWVFVSINYRLLPEGKHPANVQDVARAVAWVHQHATELGASPDKLFLMGHSAGCHLASLVATDGRRLEAVGKDVSILRGVIALDTNTYDLPALMQRGTGLYGQVFGDDPEIWRDASPTQYVAAGKGIPPFLICYSRGLGETLNPQRRVQAEAFAEALRAADIAAEVVDASDRSHGEINQWFGDPDDAKVTGKALTFLAGLLGNNPTTAIPASSNARTYDPLALPADAEVQQVDLTVRDEARQRDLPIRIYLPAITDKAPVVLFSHGLGGTCKGCKYLGEHWAKRGYVGVFLQHPGSDDSVWREVPLAERMKAMNEAASSKNFMLRVKDVPAVLDQLVRWNQEQEHPLRGRLDMERVGMSGHSFGAVTTQAVSGQGFLRGRALFTDARIKAAIAFSPSSPSVGDPATAFGAVEIPWMLMTGTRDTSPIGNADVASRLNVYPHLPPGDKYELVLEGAEHSAFTERRLPGDSGPRNPNHHRAILALSTAFWDAYLRANEAALAWLQGDGPRSVLEEKDRWQWK